MKRKAGRVDRNDVKARAAAMRQKKAAAEAAKQKAAAAKPDKSCRTESLCQCVFIILRPPGQASPCALHS